MGLATQKANCYHQNLIFFKLDEKQYDRKRFKKIGFSKQKFIQKEHFKYQAELIFNRSAAPFNSFPPPSENVILPVLNPNSCCLPLTLCQNPVGSLFSFFHRISIYPQLQAKIFLKSNRQLCTLNSPRTLQSCSVSSNISPIDSMLQ